LRNQSLIDKIREKELERKDELEQSMAKVNMSDTTDLMHAAMMQYEEDERLAALPKNKNKKKKKQANMKNDVLWDNLEYLDEQ